MLLLSMCLFFSAIAVQDLSILASRIEWRSPLDRSRSTRIASSVSSNTSATRPLPLRGLRVPVAGMVDRPDIETGTAGAGRHGERDGDGKNESPRPHPSRPGRARLETVPGLRRGKIRDWQG